MTFKQFEQWCNERSCDGCWGYEEASLCIEVIATLRKIPFWRRGKVWKKIKTRMEYEVINPTNRKIQEIRGADNG